MHMKHLNAQYLTIALSFVTILHTALLSWTDIVQGLRLYYSPSVDRSPSLSVHDITTCIYDCTRSLHNSKAIKTHAQAADSFHFSLQL